MARIFGLVVGAVWIVFTVIAFGRSAAGWSAGHSDLGFWWGVIGTLLSVATASALVGTWIHTRR
jgi:hypothetical protein